jgi:hypothetical protein
MNSNKEKGGTPSPLTLKQFIDGKHQLLIDEMTDMQTDIIAGVFDDETLPQIHDRITECRAQLNLIREIKSICNNRGRY